VAPGNNREKPSPLLHKSAGFMSDKLTGILARSASEGNGYIPRLRFGLVTSG
jgi:hypothetical protein